MFDSSSEGTNRSVDVSPASDPDMLSSAQAVHGRREFFMMPPEEKLQHFERRAQTLEDHQEVSTEWTSLKTSQCYVSSS